MPKKATVEPERTVRSTVPLPEKYHTALKVYAVLTERGVQEILTSLVMDHLDLLCGRGVVNIHGRKRGSRKAVPNVPSRAQ